MTAGASCVREADPLGGRSGGCGHSQAGVGNGDFRREGRGETVEVVRAGMSGIADGERDRKPVAGIAAARGISEYGSGGDATEAAWDGKVGGEGTWHASKGGMCTLSRETRCGWPNWEGDGGGCGMAGVAKRWAVAAEEEGAGDSEVARWAGVGRLIGREQARWLKWSRCCGRHVAGIVGRWPRGNGAGGQNTDQVGRTRGQGNGEVAEHEGGGGWEKERREGDVTITRDRLGAARAPVASRPKIDSHGKT
ncbi:hypothetical protein C8F04DRAFT_1184461 [Mycena alexandri]|uniref:Uncharacterized protein n=1 Tax=Mycena alexandri TaxID=1745969 RepID=A0AAD6SWC8_9AGAR|nr:hypothetical protein C8F04DRAFT_1184461 [Mycena alexandri]